MVSFKRTARITHPFLKEFAPVGNFGVRCPVVSHLAWMVEKINHFISIAILPWNLMVGRPRMALPNAFVSSLKVSLLSIINYNQIFSFPSKSHLTISFCQDSGIIKRWIVFLGKLACMCTESLGRKTNSCQCCICWRWISWDPRNKTYVFYMCISLRSDRYFLLASGLCDLKKYVGIIFRPRRSS